MFILLISGCQTEMAVMYAASKNNLVRYRDSVTRFPTLVLFE